LQDAEKLSLNGLLGHKPWIRKLNLWHLTLNSSINIVFLYPIEMESPQARYECGLVMKSRTNIKKNFCNAIQITILQAFFDNEC
jgi:hypothetical protein